MVKTKVCTKCKIKKLLSEFGKNRNTKDNLCCWCKSCRAEYRQIHKAETAEYRQNRKEETAEYDRAHYATIEGHLERVFSNMERRCNNPDDRAYKWYGQRGIKCLFSSVEEFIDCVMNVLQVDPRDLWIDRIDNNGHYALGNIRFVTPKVNNNNRRPRKKKKINGIKVEIKPKQ